jgi:hypothetical protein
MLLQTCRGSSQKGELVSERDHFKAWEIVQQATLRDGCLFEVLSGHSSSFTTGSTALRGLIFSRLGGGWYLGRW